MLMSIHKALGELKLLNKRINDGISGAEFVGLIKGKEKNVYKSTRSEEDFKLDAMAKLQSITSLIERRDEIKSKIVLSNATTQVEVGGIKYTVAEAIEKKNSIELEKQLLYTLERQLNNALAQKENLNTIAEKQLEQQISNLIGSSKDSNNMDLVDSLTKKYQEERMYRLVDGVNAEFTIAGLKKTIEDFENEVDYVLSISNSLTTIEVTD